jgi:Na+-transporting NADH:ubiquinone oxidoreductase subunit NqrA
MNPSSIPYSNKTSATTAVAASLVVTPSTTTNQHLRCFDITGYNNSATDQFVQVHDTAALPADGAVPIATVLAPAGFQFGLSWAAGRLFANGIVVCNSSTAVTKTIGSANCLFDITYRG